MEAMSGPVPVATAVPNFWTKSPAGITVTFTWMSWSSFQESARALMNSFWLSRVHSVRASGSASASGAPPPPHAVASSATAVSTALRTVVLVLMYDL
jgi:hypothetical protein